MVEKTKSVSKMEGELYNIGKWAIWSMQTIGYLPVTFESTGFQFHLLSFASLKSILLTISSVLWNYYLTIMRRRYARFTGAYGETEIFSQSLLVLVISATGVFTRLISVFRINQSIGFWKETVQLLERLMLDRGESSLLQGSHMLLFHGIQSDLRNYALLYFIPAIFYSLVMHGYFLVISSAHTNWRTECVMWAGTGFWFWLTLLHMSHSLWILFYIRIYTAAFTIIANDTPKVPKVKKYSWSNSVEMNTDEGRSTPTIYFGEISGHTGHLHPYFHRSQLDMDILKFMEMFRLVKAQVKSFNSYFTVLLILELINSIVALLIFSFFAVMGMVRGFIQSTLSLTLPISMFALQVYHYGTTAGLLTKSAIQAVKRIQLRPLHELSPELQLKIQLFVSGILTNPPTITAGNFFTINRRLITSMLSSICTFLVVLVQFKESDEETAANGTRLLKPSTKFTRNRNMTFAQFN